MTDDMGYETVGYNEATNYKTPNLDKLARESVVFTNCDAQPLCCPTRVKLVTGQYNYCNYKGWGSFDLEFPAVGKMMQQAGYATAVFGKWHMNQRPANVGFDESCVFNDKGRLSHAEHMKYYYYNNPNIIDGGKRVMVNYPPDRFNQRVLECIDKHKKKPFFIYYPLMLSHNPFQPTPDSQDKTSTGWQRNFEDMVAYADKMIGNVIAKLKAEGLYDDTVIFYTSDNGTKTLVHEMTDGEAIYGGKGTQTFDGCHVPLFVKYDGAHKTCDDLVDFTDFYPTIASIAGVRKEGQSELLDGVSLLPVLENKIREGKPYIFSAYTHPLNAYIRNKQYKLYFDGRLYDIVNDPREIKPFYTRNDALETAKARRELKSQLTEFLEDERYSKRPMKQRLIKAFGDYKSDRTNNWMLSGSIFDDFGYTPEQRTITCDMTPFLEKDKADYSLRFSRSHLSSNSGLIYADIAIKSVTVIQNGDTIFSENYEDIELTTTRDVDMLRRKGNTYTSFKYTGDGAKIALGELSRPEKGDIKLVVTAEVSNPDNQWGDRIRLYQHLSRK